MCGLPSSGMLQNRHTPRRPFKVQRSNRKVKMTVDSMVGFMGRDLVGSVQTEKSGKT